MRFVADSMLGKLARWLRIVGYDTVHDQSMRLQDLISLSHRTSAVFLTRRKSMPAGIIPAAIFNVGSEVFEEQFRRVVNHFQLDIEKNLFTRCLRCNIQVVRVEKDAVKGKVPPMSFDGFDEFFECPACHSVFWGGVHRTNTINKLQRIIQLDTNRTIKGA